MWRPQLSPDSPYSVLRTLLQARAKNSTRQLSECLQSEFYSGKAEFGNVREAPLDGYGKCSQSVKSEKISLLPSLQLPSQCKAILLEPW